MANVIDILVTRQAQAELDKVIASLKLTHEEIIKINQQGLKINSGASPKNPVQMNQSVKETIALTAQLTAEEQKLLVATNRLESLRQKQIQTQIKENALTKSTIDLKNKETLQRERNEKALAKEEAKLNAASSLYSKIQSKINSLTAEYQNLAARKELGLSITAKEEQRYASLQGRIQNYDKTLKSVDASMGKYQRNVGNYASGFNPLSNSISRVAQELPNLGQSFQIFAMSIGNNFAQVKEAIDGIVQKNIDLKKSGEPTKSVFKEITSSILSWNTAMYVGIAIFIAYSKQIGEFVSNLGNTNEKLIEMIRLQEELDSSRRKSTVKITNDIKEYERALSIITDKKQKKDYRLQEIKDLRNIYYYYLKDISDADLLEQKNTETKKKVANAFNEIKKAISAQEKASETNNILKQNEERLLKLKEEEKLRIKELSDLDVLNNKLENRKNLLYENNQGSLYTSGNDSVTNSILKQIKTIEQERKTRLKKYEEQKDILLADKDSFKITNEIFALETRLQQLRQIALNNTNASIGLRIKENKENDKKKKDLQELADLNIEQADFLAREFELRKKILSNGIESNKAIFDNEKNTLTERLEAYKLYMQLKEQLVKEDYDEQNKLIDQEYKSQTESINQAYNEQIKAINKGVIDGGAKRVQAETEKNNAIQALEKKYFFDRQISYEDFEKAQKGIRDEYAKEVELATIERLAKLEQTNEASQAKLDALRNRDFDAGTLTKETPLSSFKKYYESKAKIEEDARLNSLNRDIATNETKLQNLTLNGKTESEEYKKINSEKKALETQLQEVKDANKEKEVKQLEEYKKLLEDTYKGFIDDFSADSGFSKMLDIMGGGLDKFKGDAKATALVVSEAFQEAFNTIAERSQANFEAEYSRLEQQKNVSLQFAGESATAREEIERQYEERKKAIQRREAEAQKKLAIFNIAVNTAQAIIAAAPKIPLMIAMGVIGAAQLALVQSQEIPAFWKGTDNAPEGLAWTQEKGAEVITDKKGNIKTFGNNKGAQLTYLEKGDKVYKSHQDYINKTLVGAGIQPMRENNSLTSSDFNNGISKLAKTMQSNKGSNTQVFLNNKQINTDSLRGIGKKV